MFNRSSVQCGSHQVDHFFQPLTVVSSKLSALSLSMSNTPFITLLYMIGITISERDSLLHAICPGKDSTSGTIRGHAFSHAVPQTPRPFRIR